MRKLYGYSGRIISLVGYPLFALYFRLIPSRRVRVLVIDNKEQTLLVKGWLGFQKWSLPGGGCKKGETDQDAAARELWEETGIRVKPDDINPLKEAKDPDLGHTAPLLVVRIEHQRLEPLRGHAALEIIDRDWWSTADMPKRRSPLIDEALSYLRSGVK